ncbi:hypothetical protein L7F22_042222 [Adiantum nelumboides]|nr:hypothetical protein [Adiantum nelumboides]
MKNEIVDCDVAGSTAPSPSSSAIGGNDGKKGLCDLSFLRQWFLEHIDDPFPEKQEEYALLITLDTKLKEFGANTKPSSSSSTTPPPLSIAKEQCQTWFTNARHRSTWTRFYREYSFSNKTTMKKLVKIIKVETDSRQEELEKLLGYSQDGKMQRWSGEKLKERVAKCDKHWKKMIVWLEQSQYDDVALLQHTQPSSNKDSRRFSDETLAILLNAYEKNPHYENHIDRDRLAKETGLRPRQVTVWFQNRRSRSENPPLKESTEERRRRERLGRDAEQQHTTTSKIPAGQSYHSERVKRSPIVIDNPPALKLYNDDVITRIDQDLRQLAKFSYTAQASFQSTSSSSSTQSHSPEMYLLEPAEFPLPTTYDSNQSFPALPSQDIMLSDIYRSCSPSTYLDPHNESPQDNRLTSLELEEVIDNWPSIQELAHEMRITGVFM